MSGVNGIVPIFFRNTPGLHTAGLDHHFKASCNVPDFFRTATG